MMAKAVSSPILQFIRGVVEDQRVRQLSDHQLLRQFRDQQDEAAFATLLRRHGPMVLDVCYSVLGNEADAENAFQATFLTLVRKAPAIRKTASVGSWLHGVAYRTALKARVQSAIRLRQEAHAPARQVAAPDDVTWREVRQVLHQELCGLAERYRVPLVLCYLEGKTQGAAAAQLGLATSTLKERLERGRSLLRARLVRRGLGPAAVLLATAWPSATASASLPAALVSTTGKTVSLLAAGRAAAIPVEVAALTEGVLKAMFMTRLRNATALLLIIGLIGTGAISVALRGPQAVARSQTDATAVQGEKPAITGPTAKKPDESTPDVRDLKGHRGAVYFAAFSPDGATLVTAAKGLEKTPRGDEVIIWDVTAQRARHQIHLNDPVNLWSMALSPNGKTLAVGTPVGIELREVETGKTKRTLAGPWSLGTGPFCLAFAPDGKTLAAGGSARDNVVRLWNVQTGNLTMTLKGHEDAVVGLRFAPDAKTLVSTGGQYDTTIRYWELLTGRPRQTVHRAREESKDGTETVDGDWQTWPAAFSPDGKVLARGRGAEVKFWDARSGAVKDRVIGESHPGSRTVQSLAFSPNGKLLAAGRTSGEIDVWETRPADGTHDWRIGLLKQTLKEEHGHPVMALAFSRSGELLASGDVEGKVRVWSMAKQ
jgi:RNA polymerase sigma factor (sigma-70 family)